jgi:hypothetical protein
MPPPFCLWLGGNISVGAADGAFVGLCVGFLGFERVGLVVGAWEGLFGFAFFSKVEEKIAA